MAWYDTIGTVISKLDSDSAGALVDHMWNSNAMVAKVNNLLMQVAQNPESAQHVSTAIMTMDGVPPVVAQMAGNLPLVAKDRVQLAMLTAQMQSALPRSRWF